MAPWSRALGALLFLSVSGCKVSHSSSDDAATAAPVEAASAADDIGRSGYRPRDFGYRYSQLPTSTGFARFAAPRIEDQSGTIFVLTGPRADHKVVIDARARVWRASDSHNVECVGSIEAAQFQQMLDLREPAAAGALVLSEGPCKDCGTVVAEMYLATQVQVSLGSSGSLVQRRPSEAANTLLRWLLAVAIQAYEH